MLTTHVSRRMQAVQPPVIPIIGDLIRSTPGVISLGQGIVSYGPPAAALQAAARFGGRLDDHRYGPVEGLPDLLDAIARKLATENHIPLAGRRIIVTAGGNMGFFNAVLAVADPGDEIILLSPFYFNHDMAIVMAGCRTVSVPTDASYQPRLDLLRQAITPRTRAIVSISPNNPTGAVYPAATVDAINALCAAHGLYHIHDEAYEYFTYDAVAHISPARRAESAPHTISLYSLSKAYGFASWRIGYMVIPDALFDAVNKIQDTNLICPPAVSQAAALACLEAGRAYSTPFAAQLGDVRGRVRDALTAIPDVCTAPPAEGAFYYFLQVHTPLEAFAVAERLIKEHGVAVIPGSAFGQQDGCALRVSYGALDPASVAEGVSRLVRGLRAVVSG